jgi:hypothetical protein
MLLSVAENITGNIEGSGLIPTLPSALYFETTNE